LAVIVEGFLFFRQVVVDIADIVKGEGFPVFVSNGAANWQ
jgi:hypothetical protein